MKRIIFFFSFMALASNLFAIRNYPKWLESAAIYHIYPSSYMDSNGDGYGDLEGIRSRLDYVKDLGFNTIWTVRSFAVNLKMAVMISPISIKSTHASAQIPIW